MRSLVLKAFFCLLLLYSTAQAHSGPPFPVLVDRITGPYKVSLWADPDIGTGTFYLILESATSDILKQTPLKVEVIVQPASGRIPAKTYLAERQADRDAPHYFVQVPFDKQELWRVHVLLHGPKKVDEFATQVESTPDDLGIYGLLLYALPFAAIGFLWLKAMLKQSARKREAG